MKINKELLKGSNSMLVLSLLENENMYGYQIIKELKEMVDARGLNVDIEVDGGVTLTKELWTMLFQNSKKKMV